MQERERLQTLCFRQMEVQGLKTNMDYKQRFVLEFKEIENQTEFDYLLSCYDKKLKFPKNENNLLIVYLLGLCDDFDISQPPAYAQGEFPDIDMDYLPLIQEYIKNDWAPRQFGEDKVCSIGTYGKLGIKSAILDMTRVHGVSKDEIQPITVSMEDKDEDGKLITWDKALEIYPKFLAYCTKYPEVATAARMLIHRRKSAGVHAGGLIISSVPIHDFVPLEVRSVNKDNKRGVIVSAWSEGQDVQDLQPVGLVKFDVLVVDGLMQIALATKFARERHGIERISALPGKRNWSETAYLNNPASLAMANQGDLRCIFQFGSEGIRNMVRKGGVTMFNDLVAYSALYRPGCMKLSMHDRYCERKQQRETYEIHPLLEPILGKTYGVMVYQEQIMKILNLVGNIPLIHCEKIRKAISKKKVAQFIKYKEQFVVNGQKNLNISQEEAENLFAQIEAFSEYGFNLSHSVAYSFISARQLYMKSHYPIEFYTAMLMCAGDQEKIKEYKGDAQRHGIEVKPLHINRSRDNFSIAKEPDGTENIYFGFSNTKKIGVEVAKKIIAGQPYASFTDFLERFGTDMNVLKPLIALGVFEEKYDRLTLYKYYERYKWLKNSQSSKQQRYDEALQKFEVDLREILTPVIQDAVLLEEMCCFNDEACRLWQTHLSQILVEEEYKSKAEIKTRSVSVQKQCEKIQEKRQKRIEKFNEGESVVLDLATFEPDKYTVEPEMEKLLTADIKVAEQEYYGFQWIHDLEESPDYDGYTIEKFLNRVEVEGSFVGCIEVQIVEVITKAIKKSGLPYYVLDVEDALGRKTGITVWSDDFNRFKDEFKVKNLLKIRVKPPEVPFPNMTFDAPPRQERWKLPKKKEDDTRIVVLRPGGSKPVDLTDCKI